MDNGHNINYVLCIVENVGGVSQCSHNILQPQILSILYNVTSLVQVNPCSLKAPIPNHWLYLGNGDRAGCCPISARGELYTLPQ